MFFEADDVRVHSTSTDGGLMIEKPLEGMNSYLKKVRFAMWY